MFAGRVVSGFEDLIITYHKLSNVFLILFSTELFSELKMVASFFVKSVKQLESQKSPIDSSLEIFKFVYVWDFVAADGKIGRGICPESLG